MSRFRDIYLDRRVPSYPVIASPRWSTDLIITDSGGEAANQRWSQPLHRFMIPQAIRTMEVYESILAHWMVTAGPVYTFPFRNPMDFSSHSLLKPSMVPNVTPTDQVIGVADGSRINFQIIKTYQVGAFAHTRKITLPILNTVRLSVGGAEIFSGFTVDRLTGMITFDDPPSVGNTIACGYLYDVPVRFESDDSFDGIAQSYGIAGYSDLTFVEVPMC